MPAHDKLQDIVVRPQDYGDSIAVRKLGTGGALISRLDGAGEANPATDIMLDNDQVRALLTLLGDVPPASRMAWPQRPDMAQQEVEPATRPEPGKGAWLLLFILMGAAFLFGSLI